MSVPPFDQPPAPSRPAQRLLTPRFARILLAQTSFGFGWSLYLLSPKFYATRLGASPDTIGQLASMSGLFAVFTMALAARSIDRRGRKPLFRLGSLLLSALSIGYLGVDAVGPMVYLFHGLVGAAFVLAFNASATLATDDAPPERLGQAIGVLGASNMIMNAVSTVIAEQLAASVGWHAVFELGIAAGLVAFALSFGIEEAPRPALRPSRPPGMDGLSLSALAAPLLTATLMGSAFSAIFIFYQPYALSLGAHELRHFFIGFTATAVGVRVFLGNLGDRHGRMRVSVFAALIYVATAAAMISLRPQFLIAYGALFGLAHGIFYPTLNAVVMERVGVAARGRAMTFYNGAFNVGTGLSSLLWGAIAARAGYPSVFIGATAISLLAASCLLMPRPRSGGNLAAGGQHA